VPECTPDPSVNSSRLTGRSILCHSASPSIALALDAAVILLVLFLLPKKDSLLVPKRIIKDFVTIRCCKQSNEKKTPF
jgi:hypothetical protein